MPLELTKRNRIVVSGDNSAEVVTEEQYQDLLRKTIEAMRHLTRTLPPKPDAPPEPPTAVEK